MTRGKSLRTLALVNASAAILHEIQPATVRAVCYRLFTAGLIESMGKSCTNAVSRHLVWAREAGLIPWDYIVDETRESELVSAWGNPDEIITAAVNGYRRDAWQDQPRRVEVWSEKGTVRGTLAPVLRHYGVTFRVMHGYGSATTLYSAAQESTASPKPLTVLYVGDFDPSGLHMSECDLPARLVRYGGEVGLRRIALTADHVADPALPCFAAETKTGDPRHSWFVQRYGGRCWELDALNPVVLRQRVTDSIAALIDADAWHHAGRIEAAQVESLRAFRKSWQASLCSGAAA